MIKKFEILNEIKICNGKTVKETGNQSGSFCLIFGFRKDKISRHWLCYNLLTEFNKNLFLRGQADFSAQCIKKNSTEN